MSSKEAKSSGEGATSKSAPMLEPDAIAAEATAFPNISLYDPTGKEQDTESANALAPAAAAGGDAAATAPVDEYDFPDGGLRAWLVVFGSFLGSIVSFGYITSFGVYQSYYETHQLSNETSSNIAWIGSLQLFFILMGSLFAGYLFDAGYHYYIVGTGSVLQLIGLFTTAECTKLWQFILAQGFCSGIGAGFIYLPCAAILSHWFRRKRTLCFGIIASGSSFGGVIFPIMLNRVIAQSGFKWGVRTAGFVCLACIIAVNLLLKPRLPPRKRGTLIEPHHLRDPAYSLFVVAACFINLGLYIPIFNIALYAQQRGMDPGLAFYTVSVLNACSIFGRVVPNFWANKVGAVNILYSASGLAGILCFVWFTANSNASIFVFAGFYGIASGSYVSTMPACVAVMTEKMNEIGARTSLAFGICSFFSLAGPPIAGALLRHGSFVPPACFAGAMLLTGVSFGLLARRILAKRLNTWRT